MTVTLAAEPRSAAHARAAAPVDLWLIDLDVSTDTRRRLAAALSADERSRAARFRRPRDAERYVTGRGRLRQVLAECTGVAPEALRFRYGRWGKPSLDPRHALPLGFNLAHSAGIGLLAVAPLGPEVGVDIELPEPAADIEAVAERFFSAAEREALRALPRADRAAAFYRCWTRKEAVLKARGSGLSLRLDAFDVTVDPRLPAAVTRFLPAHPDLTDLPDPAGPTGPSAGDWQLVDLSSVAGGVPAALALCGPRPAWRLHGRLTEGDVA